MLARIRCLCLLLLVCTPAAAQEGQQLRRLPLSVFQDKMKGGWLGQMIGVGWGQPTEFKVNGAIMRDDQMPPWNPGMVNQHGNDDCYVEMTFMKTLETSASTFPSGRLALTLPTAVIPSGTPTMPEGATSARALPRPTAVIRSSTSAPTTSTTRSRPTSPASSRRACPTR